MLTHDHGLSELLTDAELEGVTGGDPEPEFVTVIQFPSDGGPVQTWSCDSNGSCVRLFGETDYTIEEA